MKKVCYNILKRNTMAKFKIGPEKTNAEGSYRPVYLNDNEIYRIDTTTYMGHQRLGGMEEVRKALSRQLGYEVEMRQLNAAIILESIADKKP